VDLWLLHPTLKNVAKTPGRNPAAYLATGFFIGWTQKKEEKMREIRKGKGQDGYDRSPSQLSLGTLDGSRTEIQTPGEGYGESPSVLLDDIAYVIRLTGGVADRHGNTLTYHAGNGRTHVEVKDIHTKTIDRQEVSHVVLIRTELPGYSVDPRGLVTFNTMAALGALMYE